MATNNNGNLLDTAGNVAIDFVWGNMPMQPNDVRPDAVSAVGTPGRLDPALDNHIIALSGWNGYPLYNPDTEGEDVLGATDYILTPNVLGFTTAVAQDALKDASFATITVQTAATNAAKTVTAVTRASGGLAVLTASGAGAAYPVGTKVTIASVHATVNGTYTVADSATNTITVATTDTSALSLTGLTGTVVGVAGTIKTQSIAAGQNNIVPGSTIVITPWAAAS
jgi:hypothetical protein